MNIVVLSSAAAQAEDLKKRAEQYFAGKSAVNIQAFTSQEEVFNYINNSEDEYAINILITDSALNEEINILDFGKTIHQTLPRCRIIFLTSHREFESDIYDNTHDFFILKAKIDEKLPLALAKAIEYLNESRKKIIIDSKSGHIFIDTDDIIYIHSVNRKTQIICSETVFETHKPISEIFAMLNCDVFVRCHKSYIVNLNCVKQYRSSQFFMENGDAVTVARSYKTEVNKHFSKYVLRNIG